VCVCDDGVPRLLFSLTRHHAPRSCHVACVCMSRIFDNQRMKAVIMTDADLLRPTMALIVVQAVFVVGWLVVGDDAPSYTVVRVDTEDTYWEVGLYACACGLSSAEGLFFVTWRPAHASLPLRCQFVCMRARSQHVRSPTWGSELL